MQGKSTIYMLFSVRQLQEKCAEQQVPLYGVFVDLAKAFDSVKREALWKVLGKYGCPEKLINIIVGSNNGMKAKVLAGEQSLEEFQITTGVKQGRCIAPILFILFFNAVLEDAFCQESNDEGIRMDGSLFNLARLKAKTKVYRCAV